MRNQQSLRIPTPPFLDYPIKATAAYCRPLHGHSAYIMVEPLDACYRILPLRDRPLHRPSAGEWDDRRAEFTKLYVSEGKTLKQIATHFQRKYGFNATCVSQHLG